MQPVNASQPASQPVTQDRPSRPHAGATSVNSPDQSPNIDVSRNDGTTGFFLTEHAVARMHQRSISRDTVAAVLNYGRCLYARGATIYAIGNKEVSAYAHVGVDLKDLAGYQVVCSPDGVILTAYRNHDFRNFRKSKGRRSGYNRGSMYARHTARA